MKVMVARAQSPKRAINPTKKQHELLLFIGDFIKKNNYGPSYREVMRALDYKSVSTVAVHIDNLIARGHLRKRDNSARSLEIIDTVAMPKLASSASESTTERDIRAKISDLQKLDNGKAHQDIQTLQTALQILGYEEPDETDSA